MMAGSTIISSASARNSGLLKAAFRCVDVYRLGQLTAYAPHALKAKFNCSTACLSCFKLFLVTPVLNQAS